MKYRAKVTSITSWVQEYLNSDKDQLVRDAKDRYIEVDSEDLAEQLEELNKLRNQERAAKQNILKLYLK